MYYVYTLRSEKDNKLYVGHTENLEKRLLEHNSGKVKSTSHRRPFTLIYYEGFSTRSEARWREKFFKTAWGKKKLKSYLENIFPGSSVGRAGGCALKAQLPRETVVEKAG